MTRHPPKAGSCHAGPQRADPSCPSPTEVPQRNRNRNATSSLLPATTAKTKHKGEKNRTLYTSIYLGTALGSAYFQYQESAIDRQKVMEKHPDPAKLPQEFILDAFADPASVRDVVRGELVIRSATVFPPSLPFPCPLNKPLVSSRSQPRQPRPNSALLLSLPPHTIQGALNPVAATPPYYHHPPSLPPSPPRGLHNSLFFFSCTPHANSLPPCPPFPRE